jgi:GntR family transcriptional regulator, transcriptional repressor for pyruvate dehydrogenase complex
MRMKALNPEEQRVRAYLEDALHRRQERLLPEPQLSELLDIPRGKLRTQLKRLEKEGLIWRHVGKGTFIGPRPAIAPDLGPMESLSPDHVMDARLLIEPLLAGKAAIHSRQSDIATMERCLEDMASATSYVTWKSADDRLHHAIAEATQNPLLIKLYSTVQATAKAMIATRMEQALRDDPAPVQTSNQEHAVIVAAIKSHDPNGAEAASRQHLISIRLALFGSR